MARLTLRARLTDSPEESSLSVQHELTPLASRLCMALRHIGAQDERLSMVARGFEKHLRKHPLEDEDIVQGLSMVRAMVDAILADTVTEGA